MPSLSPLIHRPSFSCALCPAWPKPLHFPSNISSAQSPGAVTRCSQGPCPHPVPRCPCDEGPAWKRRNTERLSVALETEVNRETDGTSSPTPVSKMQLFFNASPAPQEGDSALGPCPGLAADSPYQRVQGSRGILHLMAVISGRPHRPGIGLLPTLFDSTLTGA